MALTIDELNIKIEAESKTATKTIDGLIDSLKRMNSIFGSFEKSGNKVASSLKNIKIEASNAKIGYEALASSMEKGTSSSKKWTDSLSNGISKIQGAYSSIRTLWGVLNGWFQESNSYIETLNLFNVTMGDGADAAVEYANSVEKLMGVDIAEWMNYQGTFKQLTSGFGVAGKQANVMSKNLTQLSYDLSSFFNTDVETAFDKLSSAMTGQVKGLREFGIDTTVATLQEYALSKGIDASVSSMTQAEKSLLRYNYIMEKSIKMQGDMARTLETPANAVRILQAQWTQLQRALGNVVSVIAVKVIPYMRVLIEVVKEAANALATAMGFELPDYDYSGLSSDFSSGFEDAEDSASGVSGTLKKIKSQMMGMDELNIISREESNSGSGTSGSLGAGQDMKPLEYDFLAGLDTSKVDELYNKIKNVVNLLKKIWDYIVDYKDTLLAISGIIAGLALVSKLKKIGKAIAALKFVDVFLDGFKLLKARGGSFFKSFVGGLDNVRYNLTKIQKACIVAAAGIIEFVAIKDSVKVLVMGCDDVAAKIVTIGVVAAAAAGAMYTALGPAGLAVAAVVGLAGFVWGVVEAQTELRKELVDNAFFDEAGASLDTFKTKMELLTEAYQIQNEQIGEWKEQIDSNHDTIDSIDVKIETLTGTLGSTGIVTQSEIDEIKSQFDSLYECVSENMSLSEKTILTALVGAMQRATPEIAEQIDLLIGEYQRYVRETQGRAEELKLLIDNGYDELVGKQKDDPAYQEIMTNIQDWYTELGSLSGGMSDAGWQWQQTVDKFNDNEIDFGTSVEEATASLNEIADCGKTALEDLAIARDTVLKQIDEQIAYASEYGSLEDVSMLGNLRQNIADDYAAQEESIKSELNTIFGSVQVSMIGKISDVKDALEAEWDEMNWFERWWNGPNEETYVAAGLRDMQGNIDTISGAIQGHMDDLGTDGSVWADDALQRIINSVAAAAGLGGLTLSGVIEDVLSDLEESGTESSRGAGEGIATGLSEGMAAKATGLQETVGSTISAALSKKNAIAYGSDFGKNLGTGIASGFKSTGFPTLKGTVSVADGDQVSLKLKAYAQGGFPSVGEMFIAREAGPELVGTIGNKSAVANNDQIVEALRRGVYDGVRAANNNGTNASDVTLNVRVDLDGDVIYRNQERIRQQRGTRTVLNGSFAR